MKRTSLAIAFLAAIIGSTAAFASKPKPVSTLYGYDQSTGLWILPRTGSHCVTDPNEPCEAQFNGDPNNGGTMVQGSLIKGDFVY